MDKKSPCEAVFAAAKKPCPHAVPTAEPTYAISLVAQMARENNNNNFNFICTCFSCCKKIQKMDLSRVEGIMIQLLYIQFQSHLKFTPIPKIP